MQKIILQGHLGGDPETRVSSNGKKITMFSLAVSTKERGEDKTTWYKVCCFDESHPILGHLSKGSYVSVLGDLASPTTYVAKDNSTKVSLFVNCFSLEFGKKQSPSSKDQENKTENKRQKGEGTDENSLF